MNTSLYMPFAISNGVYLTGIKKGLGNVEQQVWKGGGYSKLELTFKIYSILAKFQT
jgi:hypothetical protein